MDNQSNNPVDRIFPKTLETLDLFGWRPVHNGASRVYTFFQFRRYYALVYTHSFLVNNETGAVLCDERGTSEVWALDASALINAVEGYTWITAEEFLTAWLWSGLK